MRSCCVVIGVRLSSKTYRELGLAGSGHSNDGGEDEGGELHGDASQSVAIVRAAHIFVPTSGRCQGNGREMTPIAKIQTVGGGSRKGLLQY